MLVENPLQARWYQMTSLLAARNVNVAQLLTRSFIYRSFINLENCTENSQYLNPVDFSAWGAL